MLDFRALVEKALQALEQERPADAEKAIRSALGMSPRDDQLLHLLGVSLVRQQREEEAIEPLQKAISLNRRDAEYHNALGVALRNCARVGEGIESIQRALKLEPGLQDAHYNLGFAYQVTGDYVKAEEKFRFILERSPRDVEVIGALSNLRWFMGEHEGAMQILRDGIAANPSSGDMRFRLGEQLLSLGRYEEGWFRYLWRINRHVFLRRMNLPFDSPAMMDLLPGSLEGMTIKVHTEQGIGDDLYFLRFARFLRERGARVEGVVTPRMQAMIDRSGSLDRSEPATDYLPPDAGYRLLGDLPYLIEAFQLPIPASIRFAPLPANEASVAARLRDLPRPLIGLTWRAGTGPEAGKRMALYKEVPFVEFANMAARLPGTLLVLQRQPKPGEFEKISAASGGRAVDFSALNADLEEMHAVLAQIDDYVGVSNTNMHLCAALGRRARVLVSRGSEFRWMATGAESPWFPGFPVYRQGLRGGWTDAFAALGADLAAIYKPTN